MLSTVISTNTLAYGQKYDQENQDMIFFNRFRMRQILTEIGEETHAYLLRKLLGDYVMISAEMVGDHFGIRDYFGVFLGIISGSQ